MKFASKITLSIVMMSLIAVPILVLGTFYSARTILQKNITNNYQNIAQHQMLSIDRALYIAYRDIQMIAEDEMLQEFLAPRKEAKGVIPDSIFKKWDERTFLTGPWDLLTLIDGEGLILMSTDKGSVGKFIEKYPASNTAYHNAIKGKTHYSDLVRPGKTSRPTVIFAAPIRHNRGKNSIEGVVIGHFAWPVIMQTLDEIAPPAIAHLFSSEGMTLSGPRAYADQILQPSHVNHELIKKVLENDVAGNVILEKGSHEELGTVLAVYSLQNGLFGYKGSGWGLLLEVPLEKALAPVNLLARNVAALAVIVMMVLIIGLYFVGRLLARPVEILTETVEEVSHGNLAIKAEITTKDEVGELADSFNRMTEALQKTTVSRNYVDNILNTMPGSLIVINPDAFIVSVNQATLDLLGYEEKELIGQPLGIILEEESIFQKNSLDALIQQVFITNVEKSYIGNGGNRIPVLFSGSVMYDGEGKIQDIICVATDIRERREYEEKLHGYNSELASSNRALKIAQEQLVHSAKMASIGQITAGLAHEINQPLGAIQLNAELIHTIACEDEYIQKEDLTPIYNKIHRQINRIKQIVQHLRIFSRDDKLLEFEETDVISLIDDTLVLFSQRFSLNKIQLIKEFGSYIPRIECSKIHIEQVLTNLLTNAEHSLVDSVRKVIILRVYTIEDCLVIEVEDTGYGIAEENLNKIFDPFFTTKQVGEGTGLGMSISYGIIQSHKGNLTVKSEVGKGTSFTLSLPIKQNQIIKTDKPASLQGVSR